MMNACTRPQPQIPVPIPTVAIQPAESSTPVPVITSIPRPTLTPSHTPMVTYTATPTIEPIPSKPPTETLPPSLTPTLTPTYLLTGTPVAPIAGCNGIPASANLLSNGSFEGRQQPQEFVSINVPDGWIAFWMPVGTPLAYDPQNSSGYQLPEMTVIPSHSPYNNPPRVFEGAQALRMMGNGSVFDAGVMQQVTVTPGESFCLSGQGHAWSSFRGDDPFHSTLLSSDDRRNANFRLGIDPSGGTDPWASSVIWGSTANLYDEYQPLSPVQTQSKGETVTVFVRGTVLWRFAHNELFFDEIVLARFVQ
ncbi:MAG: hypothetical protein JXB07_11345 [Anaerolineae bacterium]|nr:hypothetical protein [Anaerolineae bacterium]